MKDKAVYIIGLLSVVALFALVGQSGSSSSFDRQRLESMISLALVGINIALNALVWWALPAKKMPSTSKSVGRCMAAVVLFFLTIAVVMGSGFLMNSIKIEGSSLFDGDSGIALIFTFIYSVACTVLSVVAYLISQAVLQCRAISSLT